MRRRRKILIGAIVALVVALQLMSNVMADDTYDEEPNGSNVLNGSFEERIRRFVTKHLSQQERKRTAMWFFRRAESVSVEGTVIAHHKNILILTTGEAERLNVVLSRVWNMDSDILGLNQIFEDEYVSIGDDVTMVALNRTVTNENGVTMTIIFGYEIIDQTNGNHLYAVLPVNINP